MALVIIQSIITKNYENLRTTVYSIIVGPRKFCAPSARQVSEIPADSALLTFNNKYHKFIPIKDNIQIHIIPKVRK